MKRCWLVWLLVGLIAPARAQLEINPLLLPEIGQSVYFNPALVPLHQVHVSVPGVGASLNFTNNGFSLREGLADGPLADTLSIRNILGELRDRNRLYAGAAAEVLSVRVKVRDFYFGLNVAQHFNGRLRYPKELVRVLWEGNGQRLDETISLDEAEVYFNHYNEVGLSATWVYSEKLTLGLRPRLLFGLANAYTARSQLTWRTPSDLSVSELDANYRLNTSLPDDVDGSYFGNFANRGFALDLGATYAVSRRVRAGFSLVDLGFINWRTDVENFQLDTTLVYDGIDFAFFGDPEISVESLRDSLQSLVEPTEGQAGYRSRLFPRTYYTVEYQLDPRTTGHATLLLEHFRGTRAAFSLAVRKRFGRLFTGLFSYSVQNRKLNNFGAGLVFEPGPVQFYLATDNFVGLFLPAASLNFNLRVGLNVAVGRTGDGNQGR